MSATTLVVVDHPTLRDGLAELLSIADAVKAAGELDCGVTVTRHPDGYMIAAEADMDLPAGVIETEGWRDPVDPWQDSWQASVEERAAVELRELLEALHHHTTGDLVATPQGVRWL